MTSRGGSPPRVGAGHKTKGQSRTIHIDVPEEVRLPLLLPSPALHALMEDTWLRCHENYLFGDINISLLMARHPALHLVMAIMFRCLASAVQNVSHLE